ncbi:MAG: S-adenosylmethionine synthetase N-terminal domain-containing protein [Subdoligranulum sp.]
MNDIFENTETMKENEHPRFYTAESVMRGHPDKLCDLIADSVLDACLQHDPASRVACEVMATHGHIIVAGEITTSAKPDVFNIVRDTLRDVGYDPKAYQIDCYIHDQSPDIAGAVEPELAEGEDEDTLGAGDQGVMVGYACNETPEYLPMPVVAAQRLVTLLEISRMTGVIPDIGPDGKVQVTMEYNGDTPVRITTVVVSVQHKEDTDINKLADLLDEYVFPLAFDGMLEGISVPARKVTRPLWGRCTRITAERLPGIISARCSTSPRRAAGRYHRPLTTKWMNWSPRPSRASPVPIQISDSLPDGIQAQYVPKNRTIYVRNGMDAGTTLCAIVRECAQADFHKDYTYNRQAYAAPSYCAAYMVAHRYGLDTTAFNFDRVVALYGNLGKEQRQGFLSDVNIVGGGAAAQSESHAGCTDPRTATPQNTLLPCRLPRSNLASGSAADCFPFVFK